MFSLEEKAIIWLSVFSDITPLKKLHIIKSFKNFANIFRNKPKLQSLLEEIKTKKEVDAMLASLKEEYIDAFLNKLESNNINVVTFKSKIYPQILLEIPSFPIVLYCKGDVSLLSSECLGVVGTRRVTRYGKEITQNLVREIVSAGITIVSGLAEGVDKVAHETALEMNGKTIAILPCGFDNIYPKSNIKLADDIAEKGLLISEYKPKEKTLLYYFPVRNRIIAGVSKGVLVTEAPEKSGALITGNYAIEFNRELFAVPGRVNDIYSKGCNNLIHDCQASIVTDCNNILEVYGRSVQKPEAIKQLSLNNEELLVYNSLKSGEKHFQELLLDTKLEIKILNSNLIEMELKGLVSRLPGNIYKI